MTLSNIKKIGIILRPSSPELREVFYHVTDTFKAHGIEAMIDSVSGGMIGVLGQDFELMCRDSDMLVTIGGDGTLISAVRRSYHHQIPVLGLHAGKLGFLADVSLDELDTFVAQLVDGRYRVDHRSMLQATIRSNTSAREVIAFNDIVLTRPSISKMIHFETFVGQKLFNTYYGDGVIISTPTGSTAYNLSCGGPVLFPMTQVFVLTPISPHSLTQRPVVLPGHFELEIRTPEPSGLAVIDGQDMYEFGEHDIIEVKLAPHKAHLVHRESFDYFDVLKEKLSWGE